jgi:hypothetical protein
MRQEAGCGTRLARVDSLEIDWAASLTACIVLCFSIISASWLIRRIAQGSQTDSRRYSDSKSLVLVTNCATHVRPPQWKGSVGTDFGPITFRFCYLLSRMPNYSDSLLMLVLVLVPSRPLGYRTLSRTAESRRLKGEYSAITIGIGNFHRMFPMQNNLLRCSCKSLP